MGLPVARQLPHRARRLRGPALAATRASRPARGSRSPPSTASAGACSRRARRPTRCCAGWASRPSASGAGTAASTSRRFSPDAARAERCCPARSRVLYAGRLTKEKGADLLADAFLAARERDPRLHLALAGGGPEEDALRERLGEHATFLGWLEGDALAARLRERRRLPLRQPHGHVRPGPARGAGERAAGRRRRRGRADERSSRTASPGRLCPADAERAGRRGRRARRPAPAARAPRRAARSRRSRDRTWERSLQRLADGYRRALDPTATGALSGAP